jgi:hypothetical protein
MLTRLLFLAALASPFDFTLDNGPTPEKHLIETMPGGVAAFDFDRDGHTDLYFTNGRAPARLLRNDGKGRFEDVTARAGLAGGGFTMGAAAADYDNDGNVDLFVAGVNDSRLYRNRGGVFTDVTRQAGVRVPGWAVGAGWFDYDNDGLLDLFVVRYVQWPPKPEPVCHDPSGKLRIFCHPRFFAPQSNLLFHNRGDGTFEDVTERSGIAAHAGKGMGLAFADYDGDGFVDVFVTNDTMPNFLFHNRGNGTFEEVAMDAGAALLDHGRPVSSMGADFRDYDNDGLPDIAVSALQGETFPLFRNLGKGQFQDVTYTSRVGPLSVRSGGWSNALIDFDNDGWKDLFIAASHVEASIGEFSGDRYKQRNLLLWNRQGKFEDAGPVFPGERAHRGAAFADFNEDGKVDIAVSSLGEAPEVWLNPVETKNHYLLLRFVGTKSNRDGIGVKVRIGKQFQEYFTSFGYASSSHAGMHFGVGALETIPEVEVRWPSGRTQTLRDVLADRVLEVREP